MTDRVDIARARLVDPSGKPIGDRRPLSPAEQQAALLRMELTLGRQALRFLAAMVAERRGRKHSIPLAKIQAVQAKGYRVSMQQREGRITVQLVAPGEPDPSAPKEAGDAPE